MAVLVVYRWTTKFLSMERVTTYSLWYTATMNIFPSTGQKFTSHKYFPPKIPAIQYFNMHCVYSMFIIQ